MSLVVATIAGSMGALARYLTTGAVQRRTTSSMPVGTATVNLMGAFLLGLVVGADLPAVLATAGAGFLGGFTTFSTWMVETARLGVLPRPSARALVNLTLLTVLGVAAAALGFVVAH